MKPFREDAIVLLVANPVDVLTHFAQQMTGLPKTQVIGSGTFLDSARLRGILASKCGVAASSIDAYVLGEHGDSQMVSDFCPPDLVISNCTQSRRSHGLTSQLAESHSRKPFQEPPSTNPPSQKTQSRKLLLSWKTRVAQPMVLVA